MEKYGVKNTFQCEEFKKKTRETNVEKYGVEYTLQSSIVREKGKKTCLEKYGVEHNSQNSEIKKKKIKKSIEKYGVEHTLQSSIVREKCKKTMLEKYGVSIPLHCEMIKQKMKDTCIEKYGVENVFQSELHKDKIKNTCLEKYGVENVMHNPEIAARSFNNMAKKKPYIFPSGIEVMVQGYEPFALDVLIKIDKMDENEIETQRENVPKIWYYDPSGNKHRHYVDIYIKSQNRCIEVKSTWTFQMEHCYIFEKQTSAKLLGFDYEIWVFSENGELVDKYH
jgi:hypothetical protein